jgi:3-hydroxyisobutyrate dehydrogenase-like beta-hydroxyacid dehydrogenase
MKTWGFVGYGSMGRYLVEGLLGAGALRVHQHRHRHHQPLDGLRHAEPRLVVAAFDVIHRRHLELGHRYTIPTGVRRASRTS